MSGNRVTLSTRLDEDSNLMEEFDEYREEKSMNSKSEAVRDLLRSALTQEQSRVPSSSETKPEETDEARDARSEVVNTHLMDRIETFLAVIVFVFGASNIAETLTPLIGELVAGIVIAVTGVSVFVAFAWVHLPTTQSTNGQTATISTEGDA